MKVFADALFLYARINPRDSWHLPALQALSGLPSDVRLVTTHEVFLEVFAAAAHHPVLRTLAVDLFDAVSSDPTFELLPLSPDLYQQGIELYRKRPDKGYSLTDCISMVTMRREGITEVLTIDRHFEQEGFTLLIKR